MKTVWIIVFSKEQLKSVGPMKLLTFIMWYHYRLETYKNITDENIKSQKDSAAYYQVK